MAGNPPASIAALPPELLDMIIVHLPPNYVWLLRMLSRSFRTFVMDQRVILRAIEQSRTHPSADTARRWTSPQLRLNLLGAHHIGLPAARLNACPRTSFRFQKSHHVSPVLKGHYFAYAVGTEVYVADLCRGVTYKKQCGAAVTSIALSEDFLVCGVPRGLACWRLNSISVNNTTPYRRPTAGDPYSIAGHIDRFTVLSRTPYGPDYMTSYRLGQGWIGQSFALRIFGPRADFRRVIVRDRQTVAMLSVLDQTGRHDLGQCQDVVVCGHRVPDDDWSRHEPADAVQAGKVDRLRDPQPERVGMAVVSVKRLPKGTAQHYTIYSTCRAALVPGAAVLERTADPDIWHVSVKCTEATCSSHHGILHVKENGCDWYPFKDIAFNSAFWKRKVYSRGRFDASNGIRVAIPDATNPRIITPHGNQPFKEHRGGRLLINESFLVDFIGGPTEKYNVYVFDPTATDHGTSWTTVV